jgi:glycosyltransferase involved in cell wall biosynthesis
MTADYSIGIWLTLHPEPIETSRFRRQASVIYWGLPAVSSRAPQPGILADSMSNSSPKVSVVIPCYNVTRYIGETLDSLRAQTFRDFETILVNDGCPDTENLERVLEGYRDEIVYLKSGKWASISGSRNAGINKSSATYIALLDGDDAWEPDYLKIQVDILDADPDISLVYPNARYFGGGAWDGRLFMDMIPSTGEVTMERLITRECAVFIGVTARREALVRAGLFDPLVPGGEDLDLWMRVVRSGGKITYHRQPLVKYRLRPNSMSDDKFDLLKNGLTVYQKHLNTPGITDQERQYLERAIQKQHATINVLLGKKALYAGNYSEALDRLDQANKQFRSRNLRLLVLGLRMMPQLVHRWVHLRYPTEYAFLH